MTSDGRASVLEGVAWGALGGALFGLWDALKVLLLAGLGIGAIGAVSLVAACIVVGGLAGGVLGPIVRWLLLRWRREPLGMSVARTVAVALAVFGLALGAPDSLALDGLSVVCLVCAVMAAGLFASGSPRFVYASVAAAAVAWWGWNHGSAVWPIWRDGEASLFRPNVLLVTVSGLRADHVGQDRTPRIARLMDEGASWQRAVAASPEPKTAHRAMHCLDRGPYPMTRVAWWMARHDYATAAFVSSATAGNTAGFGIYDDDLGWMKGFALAIAGRVPMWMTRTPAPTERRGGDTVARAARWIEGRRGAWFVWVQLQDPTWPYTPPPPWDERFTLGLDPHRPHADPLHSDERVPDDRRAALAGVTDPAWVRGRYAGEVGYTDEALGVLLDALDADGQAGQTLVIVAGSHGEGLGDGPEGRRQWFDHAGALSPQSLEVPLVVRWPARVPAGARHERPVSTAAVATTIMHAVYGDEWIDTRAQAYSLLAPEKNPPAGAWAFLGRRPDPVDRALRLPSGWFFVDDEGAGWDVLAHGPLDADQFERAWWQAPLSSCPPVTPGDEAMDVDAVLERWNTASPE